jgi:hypothetical protein
MLCGIVLAVLTVQLAADPEKWQSVATNDSAIAAARDILYPMDASRGSAAAGGAWRAGDAGQGASPFGVGGGVIAVAAAGGDGVSEDGGDIERQGLLSGRVQGAAAAEDAENVP